MTRTSAAEDVGAIWLLTLQRAVGRASHDVKDALNGVSVNIEVVRSRAARPDVPASAVQQFAEAAGQQLERLTLLIDAVLAVTRIERSPADVGVMLRRIVVLCGASASSADATVVLVDDGLMGSTQTRVHGDIVRLALLATLLDMVTGTDRTHPLSLVTCALAGTDDAVEVAITAEGRRATISDGVADILRTAGVRWTDGRDLTLAFPRA